MRRTLIGSGLIAATLMVGSAVAITGCSTKAPVPEAKMGMDKMDDAMGSGSMDKMDTHKMGDDKMGSDKMGTDKMDGGKMDSGKM